MYVVRVFKAQERKYSDDVPRSVNCQQNHVQLSVELLSVAGVLSKDGAGRLFYKRSEVPVIACGVCKWDDTMSCRLLIADCRRRRPLSGTRPMTLMSSVKYMYAGARLYRQRRHRDQHTVTQQHCQAKTTTKLPTSTPHKTTKITAV